MTRRNLSLTNSFTDPETEISYRLDLFLPDTTRPTVIRPSPSSPFLHEKSGVLNSLPSTPHEGSETRVRCPLSSDGFGTEFD